MTKCNLCFRNCSIKEREYGFCEVRTCKNGKIYPDNYGRITSIALDPIEKKPLRRFYPGSFILSVGSYGCNLRCPFCQNYQISWSDEVEAISRRAKYISPEELNCMAKEQVVNGNIGVAFTYNEPLLSYEYVIDTAKILSKNGLKTVLVTNGMADCSSISELFEYVDGMNIYLKGFSDNYCTNILKVNRKMTMDFIQEAIKHCHVELTTLIVPSENDSDEEMLGMSRWIASLNKDIPLHISRFFPRFHMDNKPATSVEKIYHLKNIAEQNLTYVYTGNC